MTEKDRLKAVNKVNELFEDMENIDLFKDRLSKLEKDPKIIEYKNLQNQINDLEFCIKNYERAIKYENDKRKYIGYKFETMLPREVRESAEDSCSHGPYVYICSIAKYTGFNLEHDDFTTCDDENDPDFLYNEYVCIKCGKEFSIDKNNYREFEENNKVLKSGGSFLWRPDQIKTMYYYFVYKYGLEEADLKFTDWYNGKDEQVKSFKVRKINKKLKGRN